jgi:beta-N-acetylhexosaminidase
MSAAFITGLAGPALTPNEAVFLKSSRPCGIILFARNIQNPDQVRRLVNDAKAAVGSARVLVLVDQEGGRVQRLRPPHWRVLPSAATYARLYAANPDLALAAARQVARLTAADLAALGINTNCAPVLDLPVVGSHDVIGDRAYGSTVRQVVALGRAVADGLASGGVLPVIKHIPGHGRATVDSHFQLPIVEATHAELERTDFAAFRELADLPAAMSAHIVFTELDTMPASTSSVVISQVVRRLIGFNGLLISDDLSMKALSGGLRTRAEAVIAAGGDVALHCNGDLVEMAAVAEGVPRLTQASKVRFERALQVPQQCEDFDPIEAKACLEEVLRLSA